MFHDFRRTAATNLRRAGVPEEVAMKITGHATNAMFKRYRIVDNADVRGALTQRATYEAAQLAEAQRRAQEAAAAAQQAAEQTARLAEAAVISARLQ
jgi:integrase